MERKGVTPRPVGGTSYEYVYARDAKTGNIYLRPKDIGEQFKGMTGEQIQVGEKRLCAAGYDRVYDMNTGREYWTYVGKKPAPTIEGGSSRPPTAPRPASKRMTYAEFLKLFEAVDKKGQQCREADILRQYSRDNWSHYEQLVREYVKQEINPWIKELC